MVAQLVKNLPAMQETWFDSWVRKISWKRDRLPTPIFLGFPGGWVGKESTRNAEDLCSIPGLRRSPGEGNSYPLQYSGLENSKDCIVHGVAKNRTQLRDFHFHLMEKNPASRISLSLPQANLPRKDLDVATLQTQDGLLPKIGFGGEDWLMFLLCLGDGARDRVYTKKEAWVVLIHPQLCSGNKGRNTQAFWPLPTIGEEEGRMLRSCQKTSKKKKKKRRAASLLKT